MAATVMVCLGSSSAESCRCIVRCGKHWLVLPGDKQVMLAESVGAVWEVKAQLVGFCAFSKAATVAKLHVVWPSHAASNALFTGPLPKPHAPLPPLVGHRPLPVPVPASSRFALELTCSKYPLVGHDNALADQLPPLYVVVKHCAGLPPREWQPK